MLAELSELLGTADPDSSREDYARAVIEENALGKPTVATRRLTLQRLRELYAFDPAVPLFRVLRRLWVADEDGRPLLALLAALARDPLLRATAPHVLGLPYGAELVRTLLVAEIRKAVGERLSEAVLDKVARNAGSSWTQSGHLMGRVRKVRRRVAPTPAAVAFAFWLGALEGRGGPALLESDWTWVLDRAADELLALALRAKQMGWIHARVGGGVVELDPSPLDPASDLGMA